MPGIILWPEGGGGEYSQNPPAMIGPDSASRSFIKSDVCNLPGIRRQMLSIGHLHMEHGKADGG